ADRLRLTVGVVTQGQEPTPALEENSRKMNRVVEALRAEGLEEGEYETGRFHVRPVYSPRPRQPDPAWTQQIVAYEVTHTVLVRTRKLDRAGRLIEAANRAGANTIGEVQFDLAEPRVHRGEAIAAATANALADARALAEAARVKLVRILSLDLDGSGPPIIVGYRADMAAEAGVVTPPITPGDITVRAGVTVVYEIAPGP
ncbi:MAG: SIMPL domain-containing protein, partial [Acidobacteria bacterium]|nr:SIMPL domain-containing protein [Acidobacteriota bacterium]